MAKKLAVPVAEVPPPANTITIDLQPSPEAGQALTLRQQAVALSVVDQASHGAGLEFLRGAKQLQRKIEEHWKNITRGVDDLKRSMLTLKARDLAPVEAAISEAQSAILTYENAERERVRIETDRLREEREADARRMRELQLAREENDAARREAESENLSEREQVFVRAVVNRNMDPVSAAKAATFADPTKSAARLLASPKIVAALDALRAAAAIREQARAMSELPLTIIAPVVASNLGRAVGVSTRTYYSCEVVDVEALLAAVIAGGDSRALTPDTTYLNKQAAALRESFESVYPGCRLVKRQSIAG